MKKLVFLALIALLQLPVPAKSLRGDDCLRVVSFNIRNGEANDGTNSWRYRFPASVFMVDDIKPDIMGLQEAYRYQVDLLLENLPDYKAVGVGREDGKKEGEHMEIFYNKKSVSLKKWGTFWLSETPEKPSQGWDGACRRTATWALMKDRKSGREFLYVNTHLDHVGAQAQQNGLELIMQKMAEINEKGLSVVLTGDFNITPDNPALVWLDSRMTSARKAADKTDSLGTFNDWGKASEVIDYVYYKGFSACPEFRTINKKYGEYPFISDHFPIMADLKF